MAKSNAERVQKCAARRRARARAIGLCNRCCKEKSRLGRTTCSTCNASAIERVQRLRKQKRHKEELGQIIIAQERAGDRAQEHHLYEDAIQCYQQALSTVNLAPEHRSRLSEKLGYALSLSNHPDRASHWFGRALKLYLSDSKKYAKAVELLLQNAMQLYVESKTEAGVPLIAQARRISKDFDDDSLWKKANITMINFLHLLGRHDEVESFFDCIEHMQGENDISIRISYLKAVAFRAALRGNAIEAYKACESAIHLTEEDEDLFQVATVWHRYAEHAMALGNIELAKACQERALLITRENRLGWLVPFTCLTYAEVLIKMGQFHVAYRYLLDALSYTTQAPVLDEIFVEVGIPLALHMNDEVVLTKCIRPSAMHLAFQSGEHARVGPVATAFARLYAWQGHKHKARELLHRALQVVRIVPPSWDLAIEVARLGSISDIPHARALLEARIMLPSADVARACLSLFEALVAQRHKRATETCTHAMAAVEQFNALRWHGYAEVARRLLPALATSELQVPNETGSMQPALTAREQQIVQLVFRGLTNRAIAEALAIKERTVEAHMTSIMNALGIRSRHQLMDVLRK